MLREHAQKHGFGWDGDFHWRGGEISRLEGFSDAVFAFALTLLVVSLEVPRTFSELVVAMKGFVAFAICFAMLAQVWFKHYRFFRRYGLQDTYTVFLNCVLLFVVLFYVYPLKFLFTVFIGALTRGATMPHGMNVEEVMTQAQVPSLMMIYGLGFAAVFLIFGLMHLRALRMRQVLDLNAVEVLTTRYEIAGSFALAAIGLISTLLAFTLPVRLAGLAGYFYTVIGIYEWIAGSYFGTRIKQLKSGSAQASAGEQ